MNELEITSNNAVTQAVADKRQLADLMSRVLKKDEHYGIIPGTQKPTLYKSGAEIIARVFGIHAKMEVTERELEGGHREYRVMCQMFRNTDMMAVGEGLGMCSSKESNTGTGRGPKILTLKMSIIRCLRWPKSVLSWMPLFLLPPLRTL